VFRMIACCAALLAGAGVLSAQTTPPPPISLTIRPAAEPVPALKYQLLPDLRDQTPGNAALLYFRAFTPEFAVFPPLEMKEMNPRIDKAILNPRAVPDAELRPVLTAAGLRELDRAARREYCDWELTARVRRDGPHTLMGDVQGMRRQAQFLSIRARFQIADGQHKEALTTLQTGLSMSRQIADAPTVINALVGIAIAGTMATQVEELIQSPGSPNLYWALTSLPRPFIDLRKPLLGEQLMVDSLFPEVRATMAEGKLTPLSADVQQAVLAKMVQSLREFGEGSGSDWQTRVGLAAYAARAYPQAKQYLIRQGHTPEQVEALPMLQAVLIFELANYDRLYDDLIKWQGFPYPEAMAGVARAEAALREQREKSGGVGTTLASMILLSLGKTYNAQARIDRRIAALRCIEAIRIYAAAHDGKLPATLADIREVPVPSDPLTGKEFEYKRDGDKATLTGPAPGNQFPQPSNYFQYVLTLAK
jgi:hypothetical protein